jgi:hypothetical protein
VADSPQAWLWRKTFWLLPAAVALVTHAPAVDNGFTNWDDPVFLLANPLTVSPLGAGAEALLRTTSITYPMPVTVLALAAQRALFATSQRFGLDPAGFHAVSIALHILVVVAVVALARRFGAGRLAAATAAGLFAAHPITVEPVAWVVGQKDLLCALFLLLALTVRAGPDGARLGSTCLAGVLSTLALLAKPTAMVAPILFALIDRGRGRPLRHGRALALYGVTLALSGASLAVSYAGRDSGASWPVRDVDPTTLGEAGWAYALELAHVVWPHELLARYFAPTGGALFVWALGGLLLFSVTVTATVVLWRRRAHGAAFGLGGALVAYLPAAGLVPLTRGPADSYLYLPLALAAVALARGLDHAHARGATMRRITLALAAATLPFALAQSRAQIPAWRDAPSLWTRVALAYPEEPRALVRVGDAYLFVGQPGPAVAIYEELARRYPDFTGGLMGHGDALVLAGDLVAAERVFADGARRGGARAFRERYAFFLARHPGLEPSDATTARLAVRELFGLLAERGKRRSTLLAAANLLDRFGDPELAAALRARAAALTPRKRSR